MKISCELVKDFLPLYIEGLISEGSKRDIEEHLESCSLCSQYLKDAKEEVMDDFPEDKDGNSEEIAREALLKIKKRNNTIIIIILLAGFLVGRFGLASFDFRRILSFTPQQALSNKFPSYVSSSYFMDPVIVHQEKIDDKYYAVIYEDGYSFGVALLYRSLGKTLWHTKQTSPKQLIEGGKPFERTYLGTEDYVVMVIKIADPDIKYLSFSDESRYVDGFKVDISLEEALAKPELHEVKEISGGYAVFYRSQQQSNDYNLRAYDKDGNLVAHNLNGTVIYVNSTDNQ